MTIVPIHLFFTQPFNPCLEMNSSNLLNSHQSHLVNALFPVEFSPHYFLFFRLLNPICKNNFSKINWFEINPPPVHQCLTQGYDLTHPNICPIYEPLEHVKEPGLWVQIYRISIAQSNNWISRKSPSEDPAFLL